MTYRCFCCDRRRAGGVCTCVISTCRRCLVCLTHCECPERHARLCGADAELDAEDGPFADVPHSRSESRHKDGPK
jgi:hypothetical protein